MTSTLTAITALFAQLSLLAFGGGSSVLPEMQRQVVNVHGWMSATEFAALFALAQAAPGPNLMICALIGWNVAGLPGALLAMVGICGPSSILIAVTASVWHRFREARWRKLVQAGIVPVTVGLIAATAALIATTVDTDVVLAAITVAVTIAVLTTKLHPLWLLAAGALLGVILGMIGVL